MDRPPRLRLDQGWLSRHYQTVDTDTGELIEEPETHAVVRTPQRMTFSERQAVITRALLCAFPVLLCGLMAPLGLALVAFHVFPLAIAGVAWMTLLGGLALAKAVEGARLLYFGLTGKRPPEGVIPNESI